jgi:putative membrane protein
MASTVAVDHTDAHIAAFLTAANKAESNQARQALKRSTDARVKDFAQRLLTERTAAERDQQSVMTTSGISPMPDEKSDMLRSRSEIATTSLGLVGALDFDKTFLDTIVREQQDLLGAVDSQLPTAHDRELKGLLERTRTEVAENLATARDIQASLPK